MKNIIMFFLLFGVLLGCKKNETSRPVTEIAISTSLSITDTLGNPRTSFQMGKPFDLIFQMTNKTGVDQNYSWTGPVSEIYISQNDSIASRQYYGYAWPQIVRRGVLKADSTLTNRWLGPINRISSAAALAPGSYIADVFIFARFDNVEIEYPLSRHVTIFDTPIVVVEKPNIYLYPQTTSNLSVALEFPVGGSILESNPTYSNGWNVSVEPSGKIDRQYDYLFYESENPDAFQYSSGWIVSSDTLTSFFSNTLHLAGFNQREQNDFISYWIPRLVGYPYYIIYPQFADEIGKVIRLKISEQPDNTLRLFYVIQGTNDSRRLLLPPTVPQFERNGFVVAEWGVILK